jgi:ferredoxin-NADP reductase
MLRHHAATGSDAEARLIYSARSWDELIYRDELLGFSAAGTVDVRFALTRQWPDDWTGHRGRIDQRLLHEVAWSPAQRPRIYVCGPSGFVESAAGWLVDDGQDPASIRTERFGPSGS